MNLQVWIAKSTVYVQYSYEYTGTYCTVHCVQYVTSLIKKEDQDKSIKQ